MNIKKSCKIDKFIEFNKIKIKYFTQQHCVDRRKDGRPPLGLDNSWSREGTVCRAALGEAPRGGSSMMKVRIADYVLDTEYDDDNSWQILSRSGHSSSHRS